MTKTMPVTTTITETITRTTTITRMDPGILTFVIYFLIIVPAIVFVAGFTIGKRRTK